MKAKSKKTKTTKKKTQKKAIAKKKNTRKTLIAGSSKKKKTTKKTKVSVKAKDKKEPSAILSSEKDTSSASQTQIENRAHSHQYTHAGEIFNIVTHALALGMALVGMVFLFIKAVKTTDNYKITGVLIFSLTNVLLYLSSTLYHSALEVKPKLLLKKLDHASIFVFIAGSYTPYIITWFREEYFWVLYVIWGFALIGVVLKVFKTDISKILSALPYLVMSWLAVFGIKPLYDHAGYSVLLYIFGGGFFYSAGVFFYIRKTTFSHGYWHLFVLAANIFHFIAVYSFLI